MLFGALLSSGMPYGLGLSAVCAVAEEEEAALAPETAEEPAEGEEVAEGLVEGEPVELPRWERTAEDWELPEEMRLANLPRFGQALFAQAGGEEPRTLNMPVSPQYILGPGDELVIRTWSEGLEHLNTSVVVSAEGEIYLPLLGQIAVAGKALGAVRDMLQEGLSQFYAESQTSVNVSSTRVITVYVTGDVAKPGRYGLNGTATVLTALYVAGGPTSAGSLRGIRLIRRQHEPIEIDLYPYLLAGEPLAEPLLETGDTVFVGAVGQEIGVTGAVHRPGRYELGAPISCSEAIELAGGLVAEGSLQDVKVWRVVEHQRQEVITLDLTEPVMGFPVGGGDVVVVGAVDRMPENAVRISGAVRRPGVYEVEAGMTVGALIARAGGLDEGAYLSYGRVRRLDERRQHQYESFSVEKAVDEGTDLVAVRPYDAVRIYYRYEVTPLTHVRICGPVAQPGSYEWAAAMRIRDLVLQSGGVTDEAYLKQARLLRLLPDGERSVVAVRLLEALANDPNSNIALQPGDVLEISAQAEARPPKLVHVAGFVQRPGEYERFEGMTASDLVFVAGGLAPGAADKIEYAQGRQSGPAAVYALELRRAEDGEITVEPDVVLGDDDQIAVLGRGDFWQQPRVVMLAGRVAHPGAYILRTSVEKTETVYDLLQRGGPLLADANPDGMVIYRPTEKAMTESQRQNLAQIMASYNREAGGGVITEEADLRRAALAEQIAASLGQLVNAAGGTALVVPPRQLRLAAWATGIPVEGGKLLASRGRQGDMPLRAGDTVVVPELQNTVAVLGAVIRPGKVPYRAGARIGQYIGMVGGEADDAVVGRAVVVRANGAAYRGRDVTQVKPGDVIIVPSDYMVRTVRTDTTAERILKALGSAAATFLLLD